MNAILEERTAQARADDRAGWETFQHLPFERWPDGALLEFVAGTGFAGEIDSAAPTATELRALVSAVLGPEHAAFKPIASEIQDDE